MRGIDVETQIALYFGLKTKAGHVDESYKDTMEALAQYTDDYIYFGMLLTEVLNRDGRRLALKYGKGAPKVSSMDYSDEQLRPLMPKRSGYADFERQYRGAKSRFLPSRWRRVRAIVLKRRVYRTVLWKLASGSAYQARGYKKV